MRQMVNGNVIEVPTDEDDALDSDLLRVTAGIPPDRPLILQLPDGTNQYINPGEKMYVKPDQYFVDAPVHRRGS